jgi:hypothetical protein
MLARLLNRLEHNVASAATHPGQPTPVDTDVPPYPRPEAQHGS